MANLTLTIDDQLLKRARIRALENSTSVNAMVREFLEQYAGSDGGTAALHDFLRAAEAGTAGSGSRGRTWTREGLYSDRLGG